MPEDIRNKQKRVCDVLDLTANVECNIYNLLFSFMCDHWNIINPWFCLLLNEPFISEGICTCYTAIFAAAAQNGQTLALKRTRLIHTQAFAGGTLVACLHESLTLRITSKQSLLYQISSNTIGGTIGL